VSIVGPPDAQPIKHVSKLGRCLIDPSFGRKMDFAKSVLALMDQRIDYLFRRLIVSHKNKPLVPVTRPEVTR
jgi:hypothetical protein